MGWTLELGTKSDVKILFLHCTNGALSGSFATFYPRIFWFALDTGETGVHQFVFVSTGETPQRLETSACLSLELANELAVSDGLRTTLRGLKKRSDVTLLKLNIETQNRYTREGDTFFQIIVCGTSLLLGILNIPKASHLNLF